MEKWIISLMGSLLVSNSISTVPQSVSWVQLPHITIFCIVESAGIVLGNGVEGSQPSTASSPLGHVNFTDIKEQFFVPSLLINSSKYVIPTGLIEHFWAFMNRGLARFGKRAFMAFTPLTNQKIYPNIGMTKTTAVFQNGQSDKDIPLEYKIYKFGFYLFSFSNIILGMLSLIILFVKRLKQ